MSPASFSGSFKITQKKIFIRLKNHLRFLGRAVYGAIFAVK
jgi:hypothetical protein